MTPQQAAEAEQAAIQQGLKLALGEMQFQLVIMSTQLNQARATIASLEARLQPDVPEQTEPQRPRRSGGTHAD